MAIHCRTQHGKRESISPKGRYWGGGGEGRVGESERLTEVNKHLIQGGAETRSMQFLSNRTLQVSEQPNVTEAHKVIYEIVSCTKPQDLLLLICTLL